MPRLTWSAVTLMYSVFVFHDACAWNVSQKCTGDTTAFLAELQKETPRKYAVLMYDAFGKIGSDVEGGNVNRPGSQRECLSVEGPEFRGQYCQVFLKQDRVEYFVGVCVPDSCTESDVQTLVVYEAFEQKHVSLLPSVPSILISDSTLNIFMTQCLSDSPNTDLSAVVCLFVCCALLALPLIASIYVALIKRKRKREVRPAVGFAQTSNTNQYGAVLTNGSANQSKACSDAPDASQTRNQNAENVQQVVLSCLQALSVQNNSQGVLAMESSGSSYSSLNGIRILSLLWIISGHTMQLSAWSNLDNDKRWKDMVEKNPLYVLAFSGPVYLAVDSFLLLGGLLSAKSLLNSIQRSDDTLSFSLVAHFLFKRFRRIQPLHLFIVCLSIGLFSVVQRGVFWFIAEDEVFSCKKYWWSNLLLINNLFTITDICAPWTWYLSIDFQFYATTPFLIFLYRINKSVLVVVSSVLLMLSSVTGGLITGFLQLPVHQPTTLAYESYFQYYYNKPYTRYGPYLLGILAGIYMTTKKETLIKQQWQVVIGWLCSLSIMAVLVGLAYVLRDVPPYPSLPHAVYQGMHRSLWALALVWIILACEEGHGGFVDKILSLGLWAPLSNISFACYLIHPIIIILYNGKQETSMHYTDFNFFYLFLGHLVLTVSIGYLLTVLIEKPYFFLSKR
ncbi:O-acyltransferase like protein [Pimephales promelas]|uniref:O-acyltransferase like protein n=1 Tax=Pimephales promelas TaxID=90988 RepID=UPI001955B786|nr:O-acyltransferase like protein [Pimephales promelas]KAG1943642.1 NRF domain-containing protein [Pimephales promelas]